MSQKSSLPIISIGDLVADLIVSIPTLPAQPGQHQVADDVRLEPGGGANFLIAGARLGQPMAAIGALGDDKWGHEVAALTKAEGIDLSQVRHEGTTTQVIVLVSQSGEHVFLGKYGHGGTIKFDQADARLIARSGAIFFAGYTLCEARLIDLTLASLQIAKQNNIPVYFDPGPQISDVSLDLRDTILPLIDTVLLTEEEVRLLTSNGVSDLLHQGIEQVIIKQGAAGCTILNQRGEKTLVPGYPVQVVDTSAAGDSFDAAFIAANLWGWSPRKSAMLANAVGAAKVQKLGGGRSVPTLAEVRQVLIEFEVDISV